MVDQAPTGDPHSNQGVQHLILDIIKIIGGVADRYFTNAGDKAKFKAEATEALLQNQGELNKAMAEVMSSDAASEGWLTRNIRPLTVANMLILLNAIVGTAILSPNSTEVLLSAISQVPNNLWYIIMGGIGLYSLLRSGEKVMRNK